MPSPSPFPLLQPPLAALACQKIPPGEELEWWDEGWGCVCIHLLPQFSICEGRWRGSASAWGSSPCRSLPISHAPEFCIALDVAYSKGFWLVAPPADSWGSWTWTQKPLAVQVLPPSHSFLAFRCVLAEAPRQCFGSSQPRGLWGVRRGATSGSVNFFVAPQRINVLELGSRLRFFKARQKICFKFGSRQRRAGGRNFPGIALHFPLKGLCFGAGD